MKCKKDVKYVHIFLYLVDGTSLVKYNLFKDFYEMK